MVVIEMLVVSKVIQWSAGSSCTINVQNCKSGGARPQNLDQVPVFDIFGLVVVQLFNLY